MSKNVGNNSFQVVTLVNAITAVNLVATKSARAVSTENLLEGTTSVYNLVDGGLGDCFGGFLFSTGQQANEAVQDQLSALSFTRACNQPFSLYTKCLATDPWLNWSIWFWKK
ncbi:hypothetical protein ACJW30_06G056400 [Castanea mollissima]